MTRGAEAFPNVTVGVAGAGSAGGGAPPNETAGAAERPVRTPEVDTLPPNDGVVVADSAGAEVNEAEDCPKENAGVGAVEVLSLTDIALDGGPGAGEELLRVADDCKVSNCLGSVDKAPPNEEFGPLSFLGPAVSGWEPNVNPEVAGPGMPVIWEMGCVPSDAMLVDDGAVCPNETVAFV